MQLELKKIRSSAPDILGNLKSILGADGWTMQTKHFSDYHLAHSTWVFCEHSRIFHFFFKLTAGISTCSFFNTLRNSVLSTTVSPVLIFFWKSSFLLLGMGSHLKDILKAYFCYHHITNYAFSRLFYLFWNCICNSQLIKQMPGSKTVCVTFLLF